MENTSGLFEHNEIRIKHALIPNNKTVQTEIS